MRFNAGGCVKHCGVARKALRGKAEGGFQPGSLLFSLLGQKQQQRVLPSGLRRLLEASRAPWAARVQQSLGGSPVRSCCLSTGTATGARYILSCFDAASLSPSSPGGANYGGNGAAANYGGRGAAAAQVLMTLVQVFCFIGETEEG